jgi:hypothetical protein
MQKLSQWEKRSSYMGENDICDKLVSGNALSEKGDTETAIADYKAEIDGTAAMIAK